VKRSTARWNGLPQCAAFILLAAACGRAQTNRDAGTEAASPGREGGYEVTRTTCDLDAPYTEIDLGRIRVQLFEPEPATPPEIWQGPVCIAIDSGPFDCGLEIDLVRGVEVSDTGHVIVHAFSGSSIHDYEIDPEACRILSENGLPRQD